MCNILCCSHHECLRIAFWEKNPRSSPAVAATLCAGKAVMRKHVHARKKWRETTQPYVKHLYNITSLQNFLP